LVLEHDMSSERPRDADLALDLLIAGITMLRENGMRAQSIEITWMDDAQFTIEIDGHPERPMAVH